MAGQKLRRFTRAEVLRQIRPDRLLRLLEPFSDYFEEVSFPLPADPNQINCDELAKILADAQRHAPAELVDVLYLVEQIATPTGADAVRRVIAESRLVRLTGDELSAADVAVEAWLIDPNILIRAHASQLSVRSRSLRLCAAKPGVELAHEPVAAEVIARIKSTLAERLADLHLSAPTDIFAFPLQSGAQFVIQRGGQFIRYGALQSGKPTTVGFEPIEFDVVSYDSVHRELAIKEYPVGEREALRAAFGLALGGDFEVFDQRVVVDLDPIRKRGRECLWCDDVPGLTRVTLCGVSTLLQPKLRHSRLERASDLFAAWDQIRSSPLRWGHVQKAEMEFLFSDSSQPRKATLHHGARLRLTRDDDADLIQHFLRQRGLLGGPEHRAADHHELWDLLEMPETWSGTKTEWQERLNNNGSEAVKFLVSSGKVASTIRFDDEESSRLVQPDADGELVAVCELTGRSDPVDHETAALLNFSVDALAESISRAMLLHGAAGRVEGQQWTWWLGDYTPVEGERFPVYLIVAPDPDSFHAASLAVAALAGKPFIIVSPTRRHATAETQGRPGMPTVEWISLSECARFDDGGDVELLRPMESILRPFLQIRLPVLFGPPSRPRFPTPVGATWLDVSMKFKDGHSIMISARGETKTYSYEGLGMGNKNTPRPKIEWELLRDIAASYGVFTWKSKGASRRVPKQLERLGKHLREFLGIETSPFRYDDELKGWKALFSIEPD